MSDYVPFASRRETPPPVARPGSNANLAIWLLSLGGFAQAVIIAATVARPEIAVLLVAVFAGTNVLAAVWDRRKLANRGYFVAVSAWWAAIPPVYLWRRCSLVHEQSASGMAPFWAHVLPLAVFVVTQVAWTLGPALYGIFVSVAAEWITA